MGMMVMMTTGITTMMMMMIRVTVEEVRVLEPLIIFSLAYLSYITAGMFSWSPIISLIGCGLVQVLDNHHQHCQHLQHQSHHTTRPTTPSETSAQSLCTL